MIKLFWYKIIKTEATKKLYRANVTLSETLLYLQLLINFYFKFIIHSKFQLRKCGENYYDLASSARNHNLFHKLVSLCFVSVHHCEWVGRYISLTRPNTITTHYEIVLYCCCTWLDFSVLAKKKTSWLWTCIQNCEILMKGYLSDVWKNTFLALAK